LTLFPTWPSELVTVAVKGQVRVETGTGAEYNVHDSRGASGGDWMHAVASDAEADCTERAPLLFI